MNIGSTFSTTNCLFGSSLLLGFASQSGLIFNGFSKIIETFTSRFTNYTEQELDGKFFVKVSRDYYYVQNVVLSSIVATVGWKLIRALLSNEKGSHPLMKYALVGWVATPVLLGMCNMIRHATDGPEGRLVRISKADATFIASIQKS